ncbi:DUF2497 domain-containing protein [Asticcacaulis sp. AND118]|uniref:DUF2497 domain-containing protein n=1 Tax=Asticcacaulis sp. AND118 TaxID=2840468 RepID=UPI001CFF8970|nr:DUF2497 domain-containing protein [Asticcacaulis sp. AND118]UDF04621.1 DUF2497 domain-containing protein [Asticcacaulis sp. AND118]
MSETAHEPTMEEILASIRRIISEDDAPEEKAKPEPEPEVVAAAPEPEITFDPEPEDEPEIEMEAEEDDVLELTTPVAAPKPALSIGDIDAFDPDPVPAPAPKPAPAPRVDYNTTSHIVSERTVQSAVSAFGQLTSASLLPREGRTIEDLLTEILRPMLQNWLDGNLPAIVETAVREEVERLARQARR